MWGPLNAMIWSQKRSLWRQIFTKSPAWRASSSAAEGAPNKPGWARAMAGASSRPSSIRSLMGPSIRLLLGVGGGEGLGMLLGTHGQGVVLGGFDAPGFQLGRARDVAAAFLADEGDAAALEADQDIAGFGHVGLALHRGRPVHRVQAVRAPLLGDDAGLHARPPSCRIRCQMISLPQLAQAMRVGRSSASFTSTCQRGWRQ